MLLKFMALKKEEFEKIITENTIYALCKNTNDKMTKNFTKLFKIFKILFCRILDSPNRF